MIRENSRLAGQECNSWTNCSENFWPTLQTLKLPKIEHQNSGILFDVVATWNVNTLY